MNTLLSTISFFCLATVVAAQELALTKRTPEEIRKAIAAIDGAGPKGLTGIAAERQAALQRLQAYRYLAGLAYTDMQLDDTLNARCEAGARLCAKLGRMEHTPKNPGLPEDEYKLGYLGTSQSVLGEGYPTLKEAVDGWFDDSDKYNIDQLGHRRWCLNPSLLKVGMGHFKEFTAMTVFDQSRKPVPPYEYVAYPPPGLMPMEFFKANYAWSVSFHPAKYKVAANAVKAKIYAADDKGAKVGEALKLNHHGVDVNFFGIPNCVVFRPEIKSVAGKTFVVAIEGVQSPAGKMLAIEYPVRFFSLKGKN